MFNGEKKKKTIGQLRSFLSLIFLSPARLLSLNVKTKNVHRTPLTVGQHALPQLNHSHPKPPALCYRRCWSAPSLEVEGRE